MNNWKQFGGFQIEDLGDYCRDYVSKNKDLRIYVGTDSSQKRRYTLYATTVCFVHERAGAHVIFKRDRIPKIARHDLFNRLWKEVELSFEVGEYLEKELDGYFTRLKPGLSRMGPLSGAKEVFNGKLWVPERPNIESTFDYSGYKLVDIDLDFNPNKVCGSNMVHDSGEGFIRGNGYRCRTKPDAYAAMSAADLCCGKY